MHIRKLLMVRNDALGDFFLWLPFARKIRELFPRHRIILSMRPELRGFASGFPYFDKVITFDKYRSPWQWRIERLKFALKISGSYESVIIPMPSCQAGGVYMAAARTASRFGVLAKYEMISEPWFWRRVTTTIDGRGEGVLANHMRLIDALSGACAAVDLREGFDHIPAPEERFDAVFGIGSSDAARRAPPELFAAAAEALSRRGMGKIALVGSSGDAGMAAALQSLCPRLENLCGGTSVSALVGIIKNAGMVISNETSVAHAAALLGKKTVIISGGGNYGSFVPYPEAFRHVKSIFCQEQACFECGWKCTRRGGQTFYPCISSIKAGSVVSAVDELLASEPDDAWRHWRP